MTMIMIIITIMILNVKYISSLYAMQIKVPSAAAYDFNQLIYTVCAPPRRFRPLLRPAPQTYGLAATAPPPEKKPSPPIPVLQFAWCSVVKLSSRTIQPPLLAGTSLLQFCNSSLLINFLTRLDGFPFGFKIFFGFVLFRIKNRLISKEKYLLSGIACMQGDQS